MKELAVLAKWYALDNDRKYIAAALVNDHLEEFINAHKDGWLGANGDFARLMAKILYQL